VCDCFYNPTGNLTLSIPFRAAHSKTRFKLAMQQLSAVGVLLGCLKLFGDYFKIEWKPSIGIVVFFKWIGIDYSSEIIISSTVVMLAK